MAEPKIANMVQEQSITVGVTDYVLGGIPDGDTRTRLGLVGWRRTSRQEVVYEVD